MSELEAEIVSLEAMNLNQLRDKWRERFGAPPKFRAIVILRLMLAWRIQAVALGGLDRETMKALKRRGPIVREGQDLGVGATLHRTWNGEEHVVTVVANGFEWKGRTFRSLSAVATSIAGTRWNGPRFFGLRK